jgi:hypothetical protein
MSTGNFDGGEYAHHYPINSIICISLNNRILDAIPIRTALVGATSFTSHESGSDLAQLKFDTQRDALPARELGIGSAWRVRCG